MYPSDEFIARLWTIHNFIAAITPRLDGCVSVLKTLSASSLQLLKRAAHSNAN